MHLYRIRRGADDTEPFASDRPLRHGDTIHLDEGAYRVVAIDTPTGPLVTIDVEPVEARPT
jgi:hypothetical protein